MKYSLRKAFALMALVPACAFSSYGEPFEVNGVYYDYANGNAEDATIVNIVNPPQGVYSGAFELLPTVTYNGKTYDVNPSSFYSSAFANSAITDFTLGEGWCTDEHRFENVSLMNDRALQKVTVKSFYDYSRYTYFYYWINVGYAYDCVNLYVRQVSDTDYDIIIDKFEVYGPDGNKMSPFLCTEGLQDPIRIYPDENNTFHVKCDGVSFTDENGNYLQALKISAYYVVLLGVDYQGEVMAIRSQPMPTQTGVYAHAAGLDFAISYDFASVCQPLNGNTYTGDIVIPATVAYDGKDYPVTEIGASSFLNSKITSVVFPSSITNVGSYAFEASASLEEVDMSACSEINFATAPFYGCTSLTRVSFPYAQKSLGSMFNGCTALSEVTIPQGIRLSYTFNNCPSLLNIDILEDTEENVSFRLKSNVRDTDGNVIPLAAIPAISYNSSTWGDYHQILISEIYVPDSDGVITMPKSAFTYNMYYPPYQERTSTDIYVVYAPGGDYLIAPEVGTANVGDVFASLSIVKQPDGINDPVAAPDDADVAPVYYNLQGVRMSEPLAPGLYIRAQGSKTTKILVR